ncbi:unnamed protein product [Pleuronectes platessa]|uniref:Uncharacterized protein n=1 Tax=Pleuronectes platessa TaxID=8262 RepID=A0A9N7YIF7_PLEPL|nr:unnamed protein product [Pleuronectes platessa]
MSQVDFGFRHMLLKGPKFHSSSCVRRSVPGAAVSPSAVQASCCSGAGHSLPPPVRYPGKKQKKNQHEVLSVGAAPRRLRPAPRPSSGVAVAREMFTSWTVGDGALLCDFQCKLTGSCEVAVNESHVRDQVTDGIGQKSQ